MSPADAAWERVKPVLAAALELPSERRREFVLQRTAGQEAVAEAVLRLLEHDGDPRLEDEDPWHVGALAGPPPVLVPGQRVGPFEIVDVLGHGTSARVYAARQDQPERRVALKVLASPRPTAEQRWRFHHEAQVLAGLRHPGIATVLEAGEERFGSSVWCWFAMELVESARDFWQFALPLARRQRLSAFVRVCRAVQHGHQRGVLHRDLKPGNILVGDDDEPRVIDFGVARVLGDVSGPYATRQGQFVGTPAYASPEQLSGDPSAVDTRADIYSLGVILFQLLTADLPCDIRDMTFAGVVHTVAHTAPSRELLQRHRVPRELESVVLHALEKQPDDRYASAGALADDIERYLSGHPVRATRQGVLRRAVLFGRRRARIVVPACIVLAVMIGGAIWHWRVRDAAARTIAREEAYGLGFRDVLQRMIELANPRATGANEIEPRKLLETATEVAEKRLANSPKALIETHSTIAVAYQGLGDHETALRHWRRALDVAMAADGLPPDYAARARFGYATGLNNLGRTEAALAELEAGLASARAGGFVEVEADYLYGLATVRYEAKQWRRASAACDTALRVFELVPVAEKFAECLLLRACLDIKRHMPKLAEASLRRAIALVVGTQGRAGLLASLRGHLAAIVHDHDPVEAERLYRAALPFYNRIAPGDQDRATLMSGLGNVLRMQGKNAEGEPFLRRAFEIVHDELDGKHPHYHSILGSFAGVLIDLDRLAEAKQVLERGLEKLRGGQRRAVLHAIAELDKRGAGGR